MKFLKELIDEERNEEDINTVVLKNLDNLKITESGFKEFIKKLKDFYKIDHSNIKRFFGLTRVLEYANEGNLRDYLKIKFSILQWDDKLQIALDIARGLMHLHSKKIIHGNLVTRVITSYLIVVENKLLNGEREEPVVNTPSEYLQLYQKCWQDDPNLRPETYEILAQLEKQSDIDEQLNTQVLIGGKSLSLTLGNDRLFDKEMFNRTSSLEVLFNAEPQQTIRQFKLNHGLVLNGYDIMPSIQGVAVEDGELELNLYKGQPLVYTCINSEENDLKIDTCINFPVAEIIYSGDLLESFIEKNVDDEKKLRELYGDFFASRVLTGGQLFIIDFNSATPTQIDTLKFYLYCVYNSAKYPTDFQFSNLFTLNTLPN
ncbi:unnamed protein product [Rhizophagus irregularis]|nr:unnamed protein product [Rhizophagus irregularis]